MDNTDDKSGLASGGLTGSGLAGSGLAGNETMIQYFEWYLPPDGLLWRRAACQAKALRSLGITCAWLPPGYKGAAGARDTGYGVYDTYDLGEFDQKGSVRTKYGTRAEYLACIKALQAEGVSVLLDIVLNHRMGADGTELVAAERFDPENRTRSISGEERIEAWTKYSFPGRNGKHSPFVWDHTCFTGVDYDARTRSNGIYQFAGKDWSPLVDDERGNYDYLMGADVDTGSAKVAAELTEWGEWYLDATGADGFRLDAVKHIDSAFYARWLDAMRAHAAVRDAAGPDAAGGGRLAGTARGARGLFAVGEYWSHDLSDLLGYLEGVGGRMSLFDVPLHFNLMNASRSQGGFGMQDLFRGTLVESAPERAVTFVDNHDSQPGQSLESWVSDWFKPLAYAAILLRRDGLPCVFYADLYGLASDGRPPVPGLERLLAARRDCAYGEQADCLDHDNIIGWTRQGDDSRALSGCAVLMSDGPGGEKRMHVGRRHAGRTFLDIMGRVHEPVTVGADGSAVFKVQGGGVSVYVCEEAYERICTQCA